MSRLGSALRLAACRGAIVRVILGFRPDEEDGVRAGARQLFGRDAPPSLTLYSWRPEHRLDSDHGRAGLMHVKCAVADAEHLLLTSANLSANAMDVNMELGVCIHGGAAPSQVERHFDELITSGELKPVE